MHDLGSLEKARRKFPGSTAGEKITLPIIGRLGREVDSFCGGFSCLFENMMLNHKPWMTNTFH